MLGGTKKKSALRGKSGDSGGDEQSDDASKNEDVDITSMLSFLTPVTTQFPRQTITLGSHEPSSDDTINDELPTSNYAYAVCSQKKDDVLESVQSISRAINQLAAVATTQQETVFAPPSEFKFEYIWKHIESLYAQLDQIDINQLNQTFINMTYDKIKDNKKDGT
ncbi:uncharacterized protein LOC129731947 [Wyeomyia smithii]|uniref:uncharacterized protein LOC129731947 n=1 Tax=Wyeomyia smithii TaxID=174621 RepID=UPI002467E617|nr:uncharacterized protein LOC129731947 [Wyeomyia smithii]